MESSAGKYRKRILKSEHICFQILPLRKLKQYATPEQQLVLTSVTIDRCNQ